MRFVFDTKVIVDYIRDDMLAADAFLRAIEIGKIYIPLISLMELRLPQKKFVEIERDIKKVKEVLCGEYGAEIIPCSKRSQEIALNILENPSSRSDLGKNALSDSLIMGLGVTRRAYLVTGDNHWHKVAQRLSHLYLKILSPENILQEF